MRVPLRRLLSRLTAIAISASAIGPAGAATPARAARIDVDDELTDDFEVDPEHVETEDAALALGRGLAIALSEMSRLDATELAASWSTSSDPLRRLSLGVALEWTFPLLGDGFVLDHLSRDPDPAIRIAAARATWIRRPSGGDLGVLARLADDPHPGVRAVAKR